MIALELAKCLAPAYRCPAFDGNCRSMRHDPEHGHFPRGYAGATGSLADVALVLCIAEPGEASASAKPQPMGTPESLPGTISRNVSLAFRDRKSAFHKNVRFLMDCCWPRLSFEEQMLRTWITEGVLCSAKQTTARVPIAIETECANRYLNPQLALLKDAFVIALGRKAERRLKLAGRIPDDTVYAAGLPGGNSKKAKPSWEMAGRAFQEYLRARR